MNELVTIIVSGGLGGAVFIIVYRLVTSGFKWKGDITDIKRQTKSNKKNISRKVDKQVCDVRVESMKSEISSIKEDVRETKSIVRAIYKSNGGDPDNIED